METIAIFGVILLLWGIGALDEYLDKRAKELAAMTDDQLLEQMNYTNHFDNKYRAEYHRRHPIHAIGVGKADPENQTARKQTGE